MTITESCHCRMPAFCIDGHQHTHRIGVRARLLDGGPSAGLSVVVIDGKHLW